MENQSQPPHKLNKNDAVHPPSSQAPIDTVQGIRRADETQPALPSESTEERTRDLIGYAFIGLVFEMQERFEERVKEGLNGIDKTTRRVGKHVAPWASSIYNSNLFYPVRRGFESLIVRGQFEVDRFIETGRKEAHACRVLADEVLGDTVGSGIKYFATNPDIRELVEAQSAGLATEVVEEIRERTVSADTFLESLARSLLRKAPRSQLPEPPPAVRMRATGLHTRKRSAHKSGGIEG